MAKFPVNYFVVALFAIAGCWAGRGQLPKEVEITSEASTTATTSDVQSTDSTDSTTVTATTTRPARTTTIGPPSKGARTIKYVLVYVYNLKWQLILNFEMQIAKKVSSKGTRMFHAGHWEGNVIAFLLAI